MECAHQPATSLASAAFRSGSCDWEQRRVFSSDMRQRDGRTDKAGLLVFRLIYLSFFYFSFFCPGLRLSAARCPPPASISIGSTSVLSPLTCTAGRNEAKLPLEPPLGAPWVLASLPPCFCHQTRLFLGKKNNLLFILHVQPRHTGASASGSFPASIQQVFMSIKVSCDHYHAQDPFVKYYVR